MINFATPPGGVEFTRDGICEYIDRCNAKKN